MTQVNRQIQLAAHPHGFPKDTDFRMVEGPIPSPNAGQMLCQTVYLSLDPYMRGRMNAGRSYAKGVAVGEVMTAGTVSRVAESRLDGFAVGDFVLTGNGWQDYALSDGRGVRKLDPDEAPISTAVGVLGMPGHTAYVGLLDIGKPKAMRRSSSRQLQERWEPSLDRSHGSRDVASSVWPARKRSATTWSTSSGSMPA